MDDMTEILIFNYLQTASERSASPFVVFDSCVAGETVRSDILIRCGVECETKELMF
jgi:hypothetical protein